MHSLNLKPHALILLVSSVIIINCTPTINLETKEPVVIDVNMTVDVNHYEHGKEETADVIEDPNSLSPLKRRHNRLAEVQTLKDDRRVGEANTGLLELRDKPSDPSYLEYTQRVVSAENADRREIFKQRAKEQNKPESVIMKEFVTRARDSSFPGEWVQMEDGTWKQL